MIKKGDIIFLLQYDRHKTKKEHKYIQHDMVVISYYIL